MALVAGCATQPKAPVIERDTPRGERPTGIAVAQPAAITGATAPGETYTVKRGDTLYVIALDHGHDYKDIAAWNNLENPDRISVGQVLRLAPPPGSAQQGTSTNTHVTAIAPRQTVEARPLSATTTVAPGATTTGGAPTTSGYLKSTPKTGKEPYTDQTAAAAGTAARKPDPAQIAKVEPKPETKPADDEEKMDWGWPARGKLLAGFSEGANKGVDISGKAGDPVIASASGKVVYSGTGLRGYGKLIIIKHNATYLSAYAHNSQMLVKEGQAVLKGQKIGEVGNTDADQPMLHFEIRRQGKPVDPLKYLPPSS